MNYVDLSMTNEDVINLYEFLELFNKNNICTNCGNNMKNEIYSTHGSSKFLRYRCGR